MKHASIKTRITLFYALILIAVALLAGSFVALSSSSRSRSAVRENLINAVQSAFDDISYENGVIAIARSFDSYYRGAALIVYSGDGHRLKGSVPADFPVTTPLVNGRYGEAEGEEDTFMTYDLMNTYEDGSAIWVRGIYPVDSEAALLSFQGKLMLFSLPVMVLIGLLCGSLLTERSFRPVAEMSSAASAITGGSDLSKRLPLPESRDELYDLAATINKMLDGLEASFEREKQFSSDASHELRTPLAAVLADCEYALGRERSIDELRTSLRNIDAQARRMTALTRQLLMISRDPERREWTEGERTDLSALVSDIGETLQQTAADRGVSLRTAAEAGIDTEGDETLLMRMVMNLVENAIKYSDPAKKERLVELDLLREDGHPVIRVRDNGTGIEEEALGRIFDRFYKADSSRTGSEESFGLGLPMARWIAEAHGGTISCESSPGEGSCFTVRLP